MLGTGPIPADIFILGEAPGTEEVRQQAPFVGPSGRILDKALSLVGILRNSCYLTNVFTHPVKEVEEYLSDRKTSPGEGWERMGEVWAHPELVAALARLRGELERVQPRIVVPLGNLALWAIMGFTGVAKWRGSRLSPPSAPYQVIPSLNPAAIVRQIELFPYLQTDFSRVKNVYEGTQVPRNYQFLTSPTFTQVISAIADYHKKADAGPLNLSADLETRRGHIACLGLSDSPTEAICIPFLKDSSSPFYWTEQEETEIIFHLSSLFAHPNITWVGQNFLYDCQYFYRRWGLLPRKTFDTMIGHHSIHSNMRKGLDVLSSLYAHDHVYWKDESKNWDEDLGETQLWIYNCKDACITWEIAKEIKASAWEKGILAHFDFQQDLFFPVLRMMNRGIKIDQSTRKQLTKDLHFLQIEKQGQLDFMAGHPLNPKSPKQIMSFFYEDMKIPGIKNALADGFTSNSAALSLIAQREPVLLPLCKTIVELRSIGVFLSNFLHADLDEDERMRCSFAIAGPTTYRFSSSENAFNSGMNLQNIPVKEKEKIKAPDYIELPNIRKLFIPDHGFTFFDMDLDRADLQVVVWEADDAELKFVLREGLDLHCVNAVSIFDLKGIPIEELKEGHPNYHDLRKRIGEDKRQKAKTGVHATNYGVGDYKLATSLGISVKEAGLFRARWFAAHPGVKKWHTRIEEQMHRGYVENRFGARIYTLGRNDLPEMLAWVPQSTVAGVINRALVRIDAAEQSGELPVQLLIQVHDSLAGQFPTAQTETCVAGLREKASILIPYDDPLIIPVGINLSDRSWGHCKE